MLNAAGARSQRIDPWVVVDHLHPHITVSDKEHGGERAPSRLIVLHGAGHDADQAVCRADPGFLRAAYLLDPWPVQDDESGRLLEAMRCLPTRAPPGRADESCPSPLGRMGCRGAPAYLAVPPSSFSAVNGPKAGR